MAYSSEARRLVEAAGGVFVRHGKGTHQIYRINNRMVVVSLSRSDYRSDEKLAGELARRTQTDKPVAGIARAECWHLDVAP